MYVTKFFKFMEPATTIVNKPFKSIGLGAMSVTKPFGGTSKLAPMSKAVCSLPRDTPGPPKSTQIGHPRSISGPSGHRKPAPAHSMLGVHENVHSFDWVPEGSLAGFWGCLFEAWPAPGAREGLQICGGRSPPHF